MEIERKDDIERVILDLWRAEELVKDKEKYVAAILREIKGHQNDSFVELAVRILYRIGINCSDGVLEIMRSGRNRTAYAISTLCILLGFYDNDNSEKLLWDYYYYHYDTYSDGPLLGLKEQKAWKEVIRQEEYGEFIPLRGF